MRDTFCFFVYKINIVAQVAKQMNLTLENRLCNYLNLSNIVAKKF